MKLSVPGFCGSSSSSAAASPSPKASKSTKRSKDGKSGGCDSSFSSSSHECASTRKTPAVTREELEVALRKVVSSEEELAEMLAEADAGLVVPEELVADDVVAGEDGDLREAFAVFDANGDGKISAEELSAALASLGDDRCSVEDCCRLIVSVDVDGDGFVCFDEFSRMMN